MTKELFTDYAFGNTPPYKATHLHWSGESVQAGAVTLPEAGISHEQYRLALGDINETWQVVQDDETGKTFEVAIANLGGIAAHGMDLEISTFSSSLSGNIGNAIELAMNSVAAGRPRMYVASFGNGGSSYLDRNERKYTRETGRFIDEDGALPTIQALARTIERQDHKVTRISTRSSGGAHATALMAALPEGQITDAYLRSRPNICDHSDKPLFWAALLTSGDKVDSARYAKISTDPWRITAERKSEAHDALPRLRSQEAVEQLARIERVNMVVKAWTDLLAFSRGGLERGHPAVYDTIVALRRQPAARIVHHIPKYDLHYFDPQADITTHLEEVHVMKPTYAKDIEAIVTAGHHTGQAFHPGAAWAAEKFAFTHQ